MTTEQFNRFRLESWWVASGENGCWAIIPPADKPDLKVYDFDSFLELQVFLNAGCK